MSVKNLQYSEVAGLEIHKHSLRMCVLDSSFQMVAHHELPLEPGHDVGIESPYLLEGSIRTLWNHLELKPGTKLGISFGSRYSGVGSGATMHPWVDALEAKTGQKIARVGTPATGISYMPLSYVQSLKEVAGVIGAELGLIEVTPQSVVRMIRFQGTYALELDSSVGWRAKIVNGNVLEGIVKTGGLGGVATTIVDRDLGRLALSDPQVSSLLSEDVLPGELSETLVAAAGAAIGAATSSVRTNLAGVIDLREVVMSRSGDAKGVRAPSETPGIPTSQYLIG